MPPVRLNRRRFLGCSAAAGWAISQGRAIEADAAVAEPPSTVRVGLIGLGNRGTALLRSLLELPAVRIVAACDSEPKHLARAQGIVEKSSGPRPEAIQDAAKLVARDDLDAVVVALPCDLHAMTYVQVLRAGHHLYGEKPLGLTLAECDAVIDESARRPDLAVHVGYQRRSNPRYREAVAMLRRGDLGGPIEGLASWVSSNGPISGHGGWLASRARSGDWMVEQAVHVWDAFNWMCGGPPVEATGRGRRNLFASAQPGRDVTDHYSVALTWPGGFRASFLQSWVAPADDAFTGSTFKVIAEGGGLDLSSGTATFRDRSRPRVAIHPGPQPDTKLALAAFLTAVRSPTPVPPPLSLVEARNATLAGLLARKAVDAGGTATIDQVAGESSSA